jgi:hypothetical protein
MAETLQVNDIGTSLEVTVFDQDGVVLNLATASLLQIALLKPDGVTEMTKTAALVTDGTDGKLHYVTVANDLDQAGHWKIQGIITFATGGLFHSTVTKFKVLANIAG